MKIGVVGTGNMGGGLGRQWASKGHQVFFGSREPAKARAMAASVDPGAQGGSYIDAARYGEVVLLAVPWRALDECFQMIGSWLDGKILIDCTNPITPDFMNLTIGFNTSSAEDVAKRAVGARVVKAFNTTLAQIIYGGPLVGDTNASVFYAGDDAEAKFLVASLIRDIGFEPVDVGPLYNARFLEPMAQLIIRMANAPGMSPHVALKLIARTDEQIQKAERARGQREEQIKSEQEPMTFGR